jgi:hypothetical protein
MPIISKMELKELKEITGLEQSRKLKYKYDEFGLLINLLRKRDLPAELVSSMNQYIEGINSLSASNKELLKQMRSAELRILKLIEKEEKLVPKNAYRTRWMAIGMSVFGVPIGIAFGASLGNMAFLAIGIPLGMAIGIGLGTGMDKKALEEGRQLDIEIRSL